MNLFFFML